MYEKCRLTRIMPSSFVPSTVVVVPKYTVVTIVDKAFGVGYLYVPNPSGINPENEEKGYVYAYACGEAVEHCARPPQSQV
jgi:hypothetical protein